ncbi:MAG TPA: DUF5961 family protein [Candidatus Limnocylindria bacterium]|nr:DUF5961 family protein [Candidatus Limnocylindria bacterium]
MTDVQTRLFRVRGRHLEAAHGHVVTEASFEAAAVAWLETWPGEIGAEAAISVVVRELATGHEHCFGIDLDTGATAPCD